MEATAKPKDDNAPSTLMQDIERLLGPSVTDIVQRAKSRLPQAWTNHPLAPAALGVAVGVMFGARRALPTPLRAAIYSAGTAAIRNGLAGAFRSAVA